WLQYRIEAAVIELLAGRTRIAYQALAELLPLAMESESLFPRTMLLFHLGEAERRLGISEATRRLGEAFRLARQMGYDAALRVELTRNLDPCLLVLESGVEPEYAAQLAAGLGPSVESAFLGYVGDDALSDVSIRAMLGLFAEIGGPDAHRVLTSSSWLTKEEIARPTRNALRHIERRHPELGSSPAAPNGLRLETLGTLKITSRIGEIPHTAWRSQRAVSLFVYLAVKGNRGVSKERLIELFWPAGEKRRAIKNFHPTLTYVRQALRGFVEGPVVVVEDGLYRLDPTLRCTVDLREFEAALTQGRRQRVRGERVRALEAALALYQGEFLGDRYESWAEDLRSQVALQHEELLAELASHYFQEKKYSIALQHYSTL
ncbi:MAG TPA: BTAD domain-containing putative transcriptional regulator, partial [Candidatus Eisenbacteria bacterium]|nr:BTAD domain-containing putative transcriptional regulator [Candidatus Eisenbacteria bacterium]